MIFGSSCLLVPSAWFFCICFVATSLPPRLMLFGALFGGSSFREWFECNLIWLKDPAVFPFCPRLISFLGACLAFLSIHAFGGPFLAPRCVRVLCLLASWERRASTSLRGDTFSPGVSRFVGFCRHPSSFLCQEVMSEEV